MTDRKTKTAAVRDRSDAARQQNVQAQIGGKIAEMATLTAAASGLALGAIDMARADDDLLANNVFARLLRDDPDEQMPLKEARQSEVETQVAADQVAEPQGVTLPVAAIDVPPQNVDVESAPLIDAAEMDMAVVARHVEDAQTVPRAQDTAVLADPEPAMPNSATLTEKLTEGMATQISSSLDRIVDGISSGTLEPGFAQNLAGEIVANVRSILDEALPATTDLASSIRADVAETLGSIGGDAGTLVASSADMIDQLTGRVDDALADAGLISSDGGALSGPGSAISDLASLPASILGGSDGTQGALGKLFYDDGDASQALESPAGSAMDIAAAAASTVLDTVPLDLGFIGQSGLGDLAAVTGFSGNSNPLHLV